MKVHDVMTPRPTCCTPDTSVVRAARLMADLDCGSLPVVGDLASRTPVGLITDRDIVIRAVARARNPAELIVHDCMTRPAITITAETRLDECVKLLELHQIRRVIVVDHGGHVVGIVAQADIATHASRRTTGELVRGVSESDHPRQEAHGALAHGLREPHEA